MDRRSLATGALMVVLGATQAMTAASTNGVPAATEEPVSPAADLGGAHDLLLAVSLNGRSNGALVSFRRTADGRLAATPGDLRSAGLDPFSASVGQDGFTPLDSLPGVTWRYDEPTQTIYVTAEEKALARTEIDATARDIPDFSEVRSDLSFVLNYRVGASTSRDFKGPSIHPTALAGAFDARVSTNWGVASTTALARANVLDWSDFSRGRYGQEDGFVRLESNWRYTDPVNVRVYQAGDAISGALPWTSSFRFGGLQVSRNFDIRPDLVTDPTPTLLGTASVPSTLDLYMNNIKVFSGDVPAGPYAFTGLPFLGGGGEARIVLRDALGQEVVRQQQYFYAPDMLKPGLWDYSFEAGLPRLAYGVDSFRYARTPAGSATARYGLNDRITVEGHVEGVRGVINAGVGAVASLSAFGSVNLAVAGSKGSAGTGGKVTALYQVGYEAYSLYVGTERAFGDYDDVGKIVDRRQSVRSPLSSRAQSIDRVGVSFPVGFDPSAISLGLSRISGDRKRDDATVATASWTRTVMGYASVAVTGFASTRGDDSYGLFASLTVPLGKGLIGSVGASHTGQESSFDTTLTHAEGLEEGAFDWSLRNRQTERGSGSRAADASYRSGYGEISGFAEQSQGYGRVGGAVEGSVVVAGGGVFLGNQIDDAFAVVDAGAPDVDVSLNHRRIGTTNRWGRTVVPYLNAYENNVISIDPAKLPLDRQPDTTQARVVPADRAGAVVSFGVKEVAAASLILTRGGKPVPLGAAVRLDGSDQTTVVGYDGRTYLTGLSAQNAVTVDMPDQLGSCRASFRFQKRAGAQPEIGPVECQ